MYDTVELPSDEACPTSMDLKEPDVNCFCTRYFIQVRDRFYVSEPSKWRVAILGPVIESIHIIKGRDPSDWMEDQDIHL